MNEQVAQKAREITSGIITEGFINSYSFSTVHFVLGGVVVVGGYTGTVRKEDKHLLVEATVTYKFVDEFTDPLDARQLLFGGSGILEIPDWLLYLLDLSIIRERTNLGGKSYFITGEWQAILRGVIKA